MYATCASSIKAFQVYFLWQLCVLFELPSQQFILCCGNYVSNMCFLPRPRDTPIRTSPSEPMLLWLSGKPPIDAFSRERFNNNNNKKLGQTRHPPNPRKYNNVKQHQTTHSKLVFLSYLEPFPVYHVKHMKLKKEPSIYQICL